MSNSVNPLNWNVPIVDAAGRPTPEFMQKWEQQAQANASIPTLSGASAHSVLLGTGGQSVGSAGPGSSAQILLAQGAGADPAWETVTGDFTFNAAGVATLKNSGVTAGTYGDATHVCRATFDAQGRCVGASNVAIPGAGGGALTLISSQSLTGVNSVSFTSIPGTYSSLKAVVYGRGTATASTVAVALEINSDTGSHYNYQRLSGANGTASAAAVANGVPNTATQGAIPAASATAGFAGTTEFTIHGYAGAYNKVILVRAFAPTSAATGSMTYTDAGHMYSVTGAAITQLDIILSSGNGDTGTWVNLYGIS